MKRVCAAGIVAAWALVGAGQPARGMEGEVTVGARWELFVDRYLISEMQGARLELNEPRRGEVVLVTDKPWEGPDSAYYTILRDGDTLRLYYRGLCPSDASEKQVCCVAESKDGVTFTRPELGLFDVGGTKANNVVYQGVEAHNFAPFIDTNPRCKPEERYKAVAGIDSRLFAFTSPDGLRWKKLQPEPVITQGAFDSLNIAFWDSRVGIYRCYSRYWQAGGYSGARAIQSCTSRDMVHWDKPEPNLYEAGAPMEHFYTNATWPCPGAEQILLSFPKRFMPDRLKLPGYTERGVSDAVFMSSRDGVHWSRPFLEAWVRPGLDQHNWTQRSNMPAWGIVQTAPDEFSMYISERYGWPDNRLRRLTIPRHRFASIHAGAAPAVAVTRPLLLEGSDLVVNYATSAAGSMRLQLEDAAGKPYPGFALGDMEPLYGDEMDAPIRWKGGKAGALAGKPVRLRVELQDADLYALRMAP